MKDRKMEDLMIDYVEGNLSGELKEHVERKVEKDEAWKLEFDRVSKVLQLMGDSPELKPDASLREDFNAMLAGELSNQSNEPITINMAERRPDKWYWKVAAAVSFVVLGVVIGVLVVQNQANNEELMAIRVEMEKTRQLVIASLDNQASASRRLQGINASMVMQNSDDEILKALIKTMNTDENANVRIAAMDALARFSDEANVREALIETLENQDDPVVMIHLINLMVKLKENEAVQPLKNLLEDENVDQTVKEEIHMGILELS